MTGSVARSPRALAQTPRLVRPAQPVRHSPLAICAAILRELAWFVPRAVALPQLFFISALFAWALFGGMS